MTSESEEILQGLFQVLNQSLLQASKPSTAEERHRCTERFTVALQIGVEGPRPKKQPQLEAGWEASGGRRARDPSQESALLKIVHPPSCTKEKAL